MGQHNSNPLEGHAGWDVGLSRVAHSDSLAPLDEPMERLHASSDEFWFTQLDARAIQDDRRAFHTFAESTLAHLRGQLIKLGPGETLRMPRSSTGDEAASSR